MKDIRVAKRYAAALFGVAKRDGILDAVEADLLLVSRFLAEVPYLRAMLLQPLVSDERKYKVVGENLNDARQNKLVDDFITGVGGGSLRGSNGTK